MNKIYGMLGLARKAGKLIYGYNSTIELLKSSRKDVLVIHALDASEKTKKNVIFECNKYNFNYIEYGNKVDFGKILSKEEVSVLALTDPNIISYIKNNT